MGFCGMPSKQANVVWIDEAGDKPVISRTGTAEQEAVVRYMFQPCWAPAGRHPVQEDNNDQLLF